MSEPDYYDGVRRKESVCKEVHVGMYCKKTMGTYMLLHSWGRENRLHD